MKIFLANPTCRIKINQKEEKYFVRAGSRWPFSTVKKINDKPDYVPFPFFLAYTASLLENKGYEIVVDDGVAVNETEEELLEKISFEKPDVLLFESSTPTIDYDLMLVKKIKQKSPKTILCLTGAHITVFPQQILKENPKIDFLFLAEYELNFSNFIDCLSNKEGLTMCKAWLLGKIIKLSSIKKKQLKNLMFYLFRQGICFPKTINQTFLLTGMVFANTSPAFK